VFPKAREGNHQTSPVARGLTPGVTDPPSAVAAVFLPSACSLPKLSGGAGKLARLRRTAGFPARRGSSCHGKTVAARVQRRQVNRMRRYEMMIILDPSLEERTIQPSLDQFLKVVTTAGGSVDKVDIWGRRRLSYEIRKKSEGIYTVVEVMAEPDTVKELDRQLNLNEAVLRTKILRPDLH
jgi:small subunit ribosomal protein S6